MAELTDLANSIAESKEDIRQAMVERGVECGTEIPLADYAEKIRNMTVSNNVDSVYAVNYTGATISEGDKVFLNKRGIDTSSSFMTTKSSTSSNYGYMCLVDTSGNVTWQSYDGRIYDNNTGDIIGSSVVIRTYSTTPDSNALGTFYPKYDSYGRLYYGHFVFQNGVASERTTIFVNDDYDIENIQSNTVHLYKMDRETNEIIKTITLKVTDGEMGPIYFQTLMINNTIFVPIRTTNYYCKFTINDVDLEYTSSKIENDDNYKVFHYLTPDKKFAFKSSTTGSYSSSLLNFEVKAYEIRDDDFYQEKIFNNAELMDILNTRCWLCFNEQTGILCACKNDNTAFGVFKYENEDFTTIPVEIDVSEIPNNHECAGMSISNDFTSLNIRDKTFKLVEASDGSYKAISYTKGLTADIITGIAQEGAENGERFEAITLIPPENVVEEIVE